MCAGALQAEGRWSTGKPGSRGAFLVEAPGASVGLLGRPVGTSVRAMADARWLADALRSIGLK